MCLQANIDCLYQYMCLQANIDYLYHYMCLQANIDYISIYMCFAANKPHVFSSRISWQTLWGDFYGTSSIQWQAGHQIHSYLWNHLWNLRSAYKEEREREKEKKKWWVGWEWSNAATSLNLEHYVQICLTSYDTIYFAGSARIWCVTAVGSLSVQLHRRGPFFSFLYFFL